MSLNNEIIKTIENDSLLESKYILGSDLTNYCPNLPYSIPANKQIRLIKIFPFDYQPCGGTHTKSLLELRGLRLTKQKIKGNNLRIGYNLIEESK